MKYLVLFIILCSCGIKNDITSKDLQYTDLKCEPSCNNQDGSFLHNCVLSSKYKGCVPCLNNKYCEIDKYSHGPYCEPDMEICYCIENKDCINNINGNKCIARIPYMGYGPKLGICSCITSYDCHYGMICDKYGKCVLPCNITGCREGYCDSFLGCVDCLNNHHCLQSNKGPRCILGQCGCLRDLDCIGNLNGNKCYIYNLEPFRGFQLSLCR